MSIYTKSEPLFLGNGVCTCIVEPNIKYDLEGFVLGDEYYYVKKRDSMGIYYKIFHDTIKSETCGQKYFDKYFKHVRDEAPINYKNLK